MTFSPGRVIARLLTTFTPDFSPPTRKEISIGDAVKRLLQKAMYSDIDYVEEDEGMQVRSDEEMDVDWTADDDCEEGDEGSSLQKSIPFDDKPVPIEKVQKALDYYRGSNKGFRSLSSMTAKFSWIKSKTHINTLRRFEQRGLNFRAFSPTTSPLEATSGEMRECRRQGFKRLSALLREQVLEAVNQAHPLSYADIRYMALRLNSEQRIIEGFKASKTWVSQISRECGLCSRRITRFITTRSLRQRDEVEEHARAFVQSVRDEMKKYPLSVFANADQTGINKEVASSRYICTVKRFTQKMSFYFRTLAPIGVKEVTRVVRSVASLTHSFTAMPVIYGDGRLGEKLLVALKEKNGVLPRTGHWQAPNLLVMAGTTHIMTKSQVPCFVKECVAGSSSPPLTILLVDS